MIRARNLVKSFARHPALRGASFEARAGQVTLLTGPNGAGKTTTMRLLAGLARPDAGKAEISGQPVETQGQPSRRMFSFLPQSPAFHPGFTCRGILKFYADLRGVPRSRIDEVISLAGLDAVADKPSGHLSGGMRQRLGLALLLLPNAPVLLLDEPGLSLDPEWRNRLQTILHEKAAEGRTVLITTHLIGEWKGKADRCLLCEEGLIRNGVDPFGVVGRADVAPLSAADAKASPPQPAASFRPGVSPETRRASPWRAVFFREAEAAFKNRFLQVFTLLALAGGLSSVWLSENLEAMAHFTLQVCLYSVPLFALLLGVSSARMESEEWPVLFSQPVSRSLIFLAKFFAGWILFGLFLVFLFLPGWMVGGPFLMTASRWFESAGLASIFLALGLCVGVSAGDRVRALITGLVAWLVLFLGFDLAVAALANWPVMQRLPGFWAGLLMVNPLDAYRVQALFSLEQIPPETAAKTPLAGFWIQHARACFFSMAALWTSGLLFLTLRRVERLEV